MAAPVAGADCRRASNPSRHLPAQPGVHIWAYQDYAHFQVAREKVRNDPRWINEYLPRVKGLVVSQQDMMVQGADFFPGPP